jgi:hypothetical protein
MAGAPRDGRLNRRDLGLAVGAAALLLVVVLASSIRHDAHCDRGGEEDAEAAGSLARQALAARLLGAEQEALENQLLVRRVAGLVGPRAAAGGSFAELYADADLLAREVDAAFAADAAAAAASAGGGWGAGAADGWAAPEEAGGWAAKPGDDWAEPGAAAADDFSRARDASRAVDDARAGDDAADRARCGALRAAYAVVPGVSWGDAPAEAQTEWRTRGCDGKR